MGKYYCRFNNVTIPNGADIRNCVVRFTAFDQQVTSGVSLNAYFVDADNPDAPANKTELDAFSLTSAVAWTSLPTWNDGIQYQTPDLSDQLEAVVGRSGWESGNSVILVIEDNSSPSEVHRKISAYEYLGQSERPSLQVGWFSTTENFFSNLYWEPKQLNPATNIETSWSGTVWNFNLNADSDGGRLVAKGTWWMGYQPREITIYHTHGGSPALKVYASDGIIHETPGYASGTVITPNWVGRSGGVWQFEFILAAGDNTPFTVTDITYNSLSPAAQTSTSTTSTISTTSSTASTTSTISTTSSSSSTCSTSSTISTTSTVSSTCTSTSTSSSTSSTASTASTASTHTSFTTTSTSSSTSSTASTLSTTTSTSISSSTSSTASTLSTTTTSSSTASTTSSTSSTASTVSGTTTSSTTTTEPPPAPTEYNLLIAADTDDGFGTDTGSWFDRTADNLILGASSVGYHAYFRFASVNIPKDATIVSAILRFEARTSETSVNCDVEIFIEDHDNPTAPSTGGDMVGRSFGSAVAWNNIESWTAGSSYDSADFASILETHLSRGGWLPNQALIVNIINNASSTGHLRQAESRESTTTLCAELRVEYTT